MSSFPLVGMSHRFPANTVLSLIPPCTALYLVREPDNQYDPNAIQVWIENFAEATDQDSVEAVETDCLAQDKPMPDLSIPFMLGYIKAQTIDEDHLGADFLAPKIDAMIAAGEISAASEVPVILTYGSSGRPSVELDEGSDEYLDEDIETGDADSLEEDFDEEDGEDPDLDDAAQTSVEGEDFTKSE